MRQLRVTYCISIGNMRLSASICIGVFFLLPLIALANAPEPVLRPAPIVETVVTLERATGLALANSPVLRQARARVEQTQGLAVQAGLYPNPQQNSGNPNQLGGNNSLYSTGISQEIVRAGKLQLNQAAAQQAVRQANLELVRQQFELLTAVRQQFFMLLAAQQRVVILRELQHIAKTSEDTSIRLQNFGQSSELDVLVFRIEVRRVETALRTAELQVFGIAQQLAATLGLPKLRIDRAEGNLLLKLPDFTDLRERERLLMSSSLVEGARADVRRTQFLLQRAEAEPTPNLTLNGGYQWTVNQPHSQALVGLYFTVPIWDRNQGNIRAASANVQQSMAQVSTVQNELVRQLAEAMARYYSAQQTVETYERGILPDAKKSLELVQRGYAEGHFEYLRLLQSQRAAFETNLEYIAALQERLIAGAQIAGLLQLDSFP